MRSTVSCPACAAAGAAACWATPPETETSRSSAATNILRLSGRKRMEPPEEKGKCNVKKDRTRNQRARAAQRLSRDCISLAASGTCGRPKDANEDGARTGQLRCHC